MALGRHCEHTEVRTLRWIECSDFCCSDPMASMRVQSQSLIDYLATRTQYPGSAALALLLGAHGYRKGSLSKSGAAAASTLGALCLSSGSRAFGVSLLVRRQSYTQLNEQCFYFTGSRATKFKADFKAKLESERANTGAEGKRTATQVACNALVGTIAAIAYSLQSTDDFDTMQRFWLLLGVTFFASCMGDTLASELGILASSPPVLITTLERVPPGTNGGVTSWGLLVSLLGGAWIGTTAAITRGIETSSSAETLALIGWSGAAGLINSMLDSVLGATLQQTLFDDATGKIVLQPSESSRVISGRPVLSNNAVNALSSTFTAVAIASLASWR